MSSKLIACVCDLLGGGGGGGGGLFSDKHEIYAKKRKILAVPPTNSTS